METTESNITTTNIIMQTSCIVIGLLLGSFMLAEYTQVNVIELADTKIQGAQ